MVAKEKRMKDYFGHSFKIQVTPSFVKIEKGEEMIMLKKEDFLQLQQMTLNMWLLNK